MYDFVSTHLCTDQVITSVDVQYIFFSCLIFKLSHEALCEQMQHCWPRTPNIEERNMLCPFAHPVACCCVMLGVVEQSLKPVKL